ncbi:MAG: DUF3990 domain-containing protein [Butyrivibrio sp.]|nr:DUF3990 domain-containing protein [Butyrivibrio sp.]
MSTITLLHGSSQIVEVPVLLSGNEHNDYGKGFYCTESEDMAREWACKSNTDGFVNRYILDADELKILNLSDGTYIILNWIALLLKNRTFKLSSSIAVNAREYLIEHFAVDTSRYDIIIGYRADNSYFQYAEAFVENTLPLRGLNRALHLGKLGLQTVLVSENAFDKIKFVSAESVDKTIFYPKFVSRDTKARQTYKAEIAKSRSYIDDIFVIDILRGEMKNDDARIQRILFE